jgi:4-amino-4-deoxy-L-arabinose transferase-like glycosyltransferase
MKLYRYILIFLTVTITAIPIFMNLDHLSIRLFDEARPAINAYEMQKNGNLLVTHFHGEPDMWNTKPPLMVWLQATAMKLFGVSEWSVRLPAAIAGFLACLLLLGFILRYFKNHLWAITSMLILVTSFGYMVSHGIRTGDYDAMLTLFITGYGLSFFLYLENSNRKHLYLTFILLGFAVFTKGIAGLLMVPGLFLYALLRGKVMILLRNRHFYLGFLLFVLISGWFYFAREMIQPGYFHTVMENELGGRFLATLEQEDKGFWYYLTTLRKHHYKEWFPFLFPAFIIGLITPDRKMRRLVAFSLLLAVTYFFVISSGKTRHYWYLMPVYPFLAVIIAAGISNVISWILKLRVFNRQAWQMFIPALLLILIFYEPYRIIFMKSYSPAENDWEKERYHITYYLREALAGEHDLQNVTFAASDYRANSWFYIHLLNDKGYNLNIVKTYFEGDYIGKVLAFQPEVKQFLEEKYTFEVLDQKHNVKLYRINGEKESP